MQIITTIDTEKNFRKHQVIGLLNKALLLRELEATYAHPDFQPSMQAIWDFTSADFSGIDLVDIEEVATFVKSNWSEASSTKVALVVPDSLGALVSEKYVNLLRGNPEGMTRVFRDHEEALAWLD